MESLRKDPRWEVVRVYKFVLALTFHTLKLCSIQAVQESVCLTNTSVCVCVCVCVTCNTRVICLYSGSAGFSVS